VFRITQGLGGGGMVPVSQLILADSFPPAKRGQAFALFGVAVVVAPVVGPTLGGWATCAPTACGRSVSCWQCHHEAVLCADCWPDHMAVPTFGPRHGVHPMRQHRRGRPGLGPAGREYHRRALARVRASSHCVHPETVQH
jgi:hypothetical protein